MSSTNFPDLVLENILSYLSCNECLPTRLISSKWDAVVMARHRRNPGRVLLREVTDFNNFVDVFAKGKYGNPFKKYVLSPAEGKDEEFVAFAKFAGLQITELTADLFRGSSGVDWGRWSRPGKPGHSEYGVLFFTRLTLLLQFTPNVEYLGIMFLGAKFEKPGSPISSEALPHLPKLKIFARVPAHRYTGWCDALIKQSQFLQGAREINANMFRLEDQNFPNVEPLIVNGYPLKNNITFVIRQHDALATMETTLRQDAKYLKYAQIQYYPVGDKSQIFRFPFYSLPTMSDLYYSEHAYGYSSLVFHSGQFPNLRRLIIEVASDIVGEYPFKNCIIPTVDELTLAVSAKDCKTWKLVNNFPNLRTLIIYATSRFAEYQLRYLLQPFQGHEILKCLIVEDTRGGSNSERFLPYWEEIFGLGRNHACTPQKPDGFSPLVQTRCSIANCPGGKGLVFPCVRKLELAGVELDNVLPLLIRSIRSASFPKIENVVLTGHTTKAYSATEVPNVEDYKTMLNAVVQHVELKIK